MFMPVHGHMKVSTDIRGSQKRASDVLEMELEMAAFHVDAGNNSGPLQEQPELITADLSP